MNHSLTVVCDGQDYQVGKEDIKIKQVAELDAEEREIYEKDGLIYASMFFDKPIDIDLEEGLQMVVDAAIKLMVADQLSFDKLIILNDCLEFYIAKGGKSSRQVEVPSVGTEILGWPEVEKILLDLSKEL